jgi:dihydroflavonol-4-reductase
MSRAALTGATGYLGLTLAQRLRAEGRSLTALVRRSSDPAAIDRLRALDATLVEGDLSDPAALRRLFEDADLAVHCAALIAYRPRLNAAMWRINVDGTERVAEACLATSVPRLVHVSSIAAVGLSDDRTLLGEDSPWEAGRLRMAYLDTKRAAEERIADAVARGLDAVIVNPAAIYGPAEVLSRTGGLVERVALGRLRVAPPGGINVVPLETVVEGILAAERHGRAGRRYILGGENVEIPSLFERIARAADRSLRPLVLPAWTRVPLRLAMNALDPLVPLSAWYTPDLCGAFGRWMWCDTRRMTTELGVSAGDFDACLADTVAQLRRDGRLP